MDTYKIDDAIAGLKETRVKALETLAERQLEWEQMGKRRPRRSPKQLYELLEQAIRTFEKMRADMQRGIEHESYVNDRKVVL